MEQCKRGSPSDSVGLPMQVSRPAGVRADRDVPEGGPGGSPATPPRCGVQPRTVPRAADGGKGLSRKGVLGSCKFVLRCFRVFVLFLRAFSYFVLVYFRGAMRVALPPRALPTPQEPPRRRNIREGKPRNGGDARPPWVSALDIEAEQRRRKYALSEEEYAKKMASRVSKHLQEVRLEKYAQFDDELSTSSFPGDLNEEAGARAKGRAGDRRDDEDGAHDPGALAPVSFDLDMALFWARRRADAARTTATKNATAVESEERRSKANAKEREIQELRGALAREKSRNERLTIELEKKTKETERLRSQLAKIKLSQDPPSAPTPRVDRRRGATRKVLEDQLPLYAQLRSTETARDAWFMKTTTRWY